VFILSHKINKIRLHFRFSGFFYICEKACIANQNGEYEPSHAKYIDTQDDDYCMARFI